jgi:hypothetical protein
MAFQVEPTRLGRRRSLAPAMVVVAAGVLVVAFGFLTARPAAVERVASSRPAAAIVVVAASATPGTSSPPASPVSSRGAPPWAVRPAGPAPIGAPDVTCHGLGHSRCQAVAAAVLDIVSIDSPPIAGIDVWASLICGNALDCPSDRLRGRPLGSAAVSFGPGGPTAWANVVAATPDTAYPQGASTATAWMVRWSP